MEYKLERNHFYYCAYFDIDDHSDGYNPLKDDLLMNGLDINLMKDVLDFILNDDYEFIRKKHSDSKIHDAFIALGYKHTQTIKYFRDIFRYDEFGDIEYVKYDLTEDLMNKIYNIYDCIMNINYDRFKIMNIIECDDESINFFRKPSNIFMYYVCKKFKFGGFEDFKYHIDGDNDFMIVESYNDEYFIEFGKNNSVKISSHPKLSETCL